MAGFAAGNTVLQTPAGNAPVKVGTATYHFLRIPVTFQTWEFLGIAFIIFVLSRHWGRFVNDIT